MFKRKKIDWKRKCKEQKRKNDELWRGLNNAYSSRDFYWGRCSNHEKEMRRQEREFLVKYERVSRRLMEALDRLNGFGNGNKA